MPVWHDNETDVDLVGYDRLVETIVFLVKQHHLRPLTLGVFGDWGSGKSSLIKMACAILSTDESFECVMFSPWLHKDYDDVKAALMVAVLASLRRRRSLFAKLEDTTRVEAVALWHKLAKRVDWFRLIGFAAKNIAGAALAAHGFPAGAMLNMHALGDLGQLDKVDETRPEEKTAEQKDTIEVKLETIDKGELLEQSIDEFRADFTKLLERLEITSLVVFIDDIDRCLPDQVIEIFEALKLFLAVPKTDFIIAADERIVRHAIETRYPALSKYASRIGRDYLEKIIQIPVYIPPLTPAETETYLNLLTLEAATEQADFSKLVEAAKSIRADATLDVAMNYGIAKSNVNTLDESADASMQLVQSVAPILCTQLEGNPRRIKRFFNTLHLRIHMAKARKVTLNISILTKLMVLEYFYEAFFMQVFQWQLDGHGMAKQLSVLEASAASAEKNEFLNRLSEFKISADVEGVRSWIELQPPLGDTNLAPYFYFSRDKIPAPTSTSRRLSQSLQQLVSELQSDSEAQRKIGIDKMQKLSPLERKAAYEVLLANFSQAPDNSILEDMVTRLAAAHLELVPSFAARLSEIPPQTLRASLPLSIANKFTPVPDSLKALGQEWGRGANETLAKVARKALS